MLQWKECCPLPLPRQLPVSSRLILNRFFAIGNLQDSTLFPYFSQKQHRPGLPFQLPQSSHCMRPSTLPCRAGNTFPQFGTAQNHGGNNTYKRDPTSVKQNQIIESTYNLLSIQLSHQTHAHISLIIIQTYHINLVIPHYSSQLPANIISKNRCFFQNAAMWRWRSQKAQAVNWQLTPTKILIKSHANLFDTFSSMKLPNHCEKNISILAWLASCEIMTAQGRSRSMSNGWCAIASGSERMLYVSVFQKFNGCPIEYHDCAWPSLPNFLSSLVFSILRAGLEVGTC